MNLASCNTGCSSNEIEKKSRTGDGLENEVREEARELALSLFEWDRAASGMSVPTSMSGHSLSEVELEISGALRGSIPYWQAHSSAIGAFQSDPDYCDLHSKSRYGSIFHALHINDGFDHDDLCSFCQEKQPSSSEVPHRKDEEGLAFGADFAGGDEGFGREWLEIECSAHLSKEETGTTADELIASILNILEGSKDPVQVQSELFDLLGEGGLGFIGDLVLHRDAIVGRLAQKGPVAPSPCNMSEITVVKGDRRVNAAGRAQERFLARFGLGEFGDIISKAEHSAYDDLRTVVLEGATGGPDDVRDDLKVSAPSFGKTLLPEGTTVKNYEDRVEVVVPVLPPPKQVVDFVPIAAFSKFGQKVFHKYSSLNRIQSVLFAVAYKTNNNLLVCSPTGSGKTDVSMMTMLREIEQHVYGERVTSSAAFKIIYVAPMKALAAEHVRNFSSRLGPCGVVVRELTGDMNLTKREIAGTHVIVTTPEKWDVVTRKPSDLLISHQVKLLIIDEVHLLNDDRGSVIEAIVARTLRQTESAQSMIRIVGLSATLPNYTDVAYFLRVNPAVGLFYFDNRYRPVPLSQHFIGVKNASPNRLNRVAFDKVVKSLKRGDQVMVFVHSRKDTAGTAKEMRRMAKLANLEGLCLPADPFAAHLAMKDAGKKGNEELMELLRSGFGVHHAGMLRVDRHLVERMFRDGHLRVLCCTATLAWGVNLPAHTVVIKGTQIYNPERGGFVELSMLDVMQIFGRAGRPQFDDSGEGMVITTHDKLAHYLRLLNHQLPIESTLMESLPEMLNAEVSLGTVSNDDEAVEWLSYTYLFVRMLRNPTLYGVPMSAERRRDDPQLFDFRLRLIRKAMRQLEDARMCRSTGDTKQLFATRLGRVASHYYLKVESIVCYNEELSPNITLEQAFRIVALSSEFRNIRVREEESEELDRLDQDAPLKIPGPLEDNQRKALTLLQAFISNCRVEGFALVADSNYVSVNVPRIAGGLFEISLSHGWSTVVYHFLQISRMVNRRVWWFQHPLRQFKPMLPVDIVEKVENRRVPLVDLVEMSASDVGAFVRHAVYGPLVLQCARNIPRLEVDVRVQPITRSVVRLEVRVVPAFDWHAKVHGSSEMFWLVVEDDANEFIYHSEQLLVRVSKLQEAIVSFNIPIFEPVPHHYLLHIMPERWLGADVLIEVPLATLVLPKMVASHTPLLDLTPLPKGVLKNSKFESLFGFTHFNPTQTQVYHVMYHTDRDVLMGSPTGSGKTAVAELAMLRVFNECPGRKIVYIGPLKALVRERMKDWGERIVKILGKELVELTGETAPSMGDLLKADILCTTPEKWDVVSRHWQARSYVRRIALLILDEIHLLGSDRGPVLEVIVSRMRYVSSQTKVPIRIVGLSTALANPMDLAEWLGIHEDSSLFNFHPSVRPVPLQIHIQGFSGKHYCPRMATMNKPCFNAILSYSPSKSVLIFVASRRQTRLTALDFIAILHSQQVGDPKRFLSMGEEELSVVCRRVEDPNLAHTLQFGIGLHHAGLRESDRQIAEDLFRSNKIQVLFSTSTLAWGVNLPAHLVIIKGTEYFDARSSRYVDFPITDVLQMMGRAGRPQYDASGVVVIMVHEPKKNFYKKFIYEPFPVESSLIAHFSDHLNAEICARSVVTPQDGVDYLSWTYLFRRLRANPSYYGLENGSEDEVNIYCSKLIRRSIAALEDSGCVVRKTSDELPKGHDAALASRKEIGAVFLFPTTLGKIASHYYLSHETVGFFEAEFRRHSGIVPFSELIRMVSHAREYAELPVRHNEDLINQTLDREIRFPVRGDFLDPYVKAEILFQAHFSRLPLPISDYETDLKSVLDQAIRILQAMIDVCADAGRLFTCLRLMSLTQMVVQGVWMDDDSLCALPGVTKEFSASLMDEFGITNAPALAHAVATREDIRKWLTRSRSLSGTDSFRRGREARSASEFFLSVVSTLPIITVVARARASSSEPRERTKISVEVHLHRLGKYSPRLFSRMRKAAGDSWWVLVGDQLGTLYGLKRVPLMRDANVTISVVIDETSRMPKLTLYVVNDTFVGFDRVVSLSWKDS